MTTLERYRHLVEISNEQRELANKALNNLDWLGYATHLHISHRLSQSAHDHYLLLPLKTRRNVATKSLRGKAVPFIHMLMA